MLSRKLKNIFLFVWSKLLC